MLRLTSFLLVSASFTCLQQGLVKGDFLFSNNFDNFFEDPFENSFDFDRFGVGFYPWRPLRQLDHDARQTSRDRSCCQCQKRKELERPRVDKTKAEEAKVSKKQSEPVWVATTERTLCQKKHFGKVESPLAAYPDSLRLTLKEEKKEGGRRWAEVSAELVDGQRHHMGQVELPAGATHVRAVSRPSADPPSVHILGVDCRTTRTKKSSSDLRAERTNPPKTETSKTKVKEPVKDDVTIEVEE